MSNKLLLLLVGAAIGGGVVYACQSPCAKKKLGKLIVGALKLKEDATTLLAQVKEGVADAVAEATHEQCACDATDENTATA